MTDRKDITDTWEAQINALLDGELAEDEIAALKRQAKGDVELAQAIIDAYALQANLDELRIERAPESLRTRLAEIPQTEQPLHQPKKPVRWFGMPRWVPAGAMAAVPLLVIAMVMMQPDTPAPGAQTEQPQYTEAEILKARNDVLLAFAYLDRVGERTGRQIESELSEELSRGVNRGVSRYMPYTDHEEQEESS